MPAYESQPYGGKTVFARPRRSANFQAMFLSLVVPWLLFTFIFTVLSFTTHYQTPLIASMTVWMGLALVAIMGYFAYNAAKQGVGNSVWYFFIFISSLLALMAACAWGSYNFSKNMQPFYDVLSLNVYNSVDPQQFKGNQLMDMGRVSFTEDSRLDLTKSMGFRNNDVYCAAPIVSGNGSMASYDFWAVGMNCCSGHASDFACGEYNNPKAHAGLRLMRDDLRPYFRLAVQQAQAAYSLQATHPIFVYWMEDPHAEINAYQDEGYKQYLLGVFLHFAVQFFFVCAAGALFAKMG